MHLKFPLIKENEIILFPVCLLSSEKQEKQDHMFLQTKKWFFLQCLHRWMDFVKIMPSIYSLIEMSLFS